MSESTATSLLKEMQEMSNATVVPANVPVVTTAAVATEKKAAKKRAPRKAKTAGDTKAAAAGSSEEKKKPKKPPHPHVAATGLIRTAVVKDLMGYQLRAQLKTGEMKLNKKGEPQEVMKKTSQMFLMATATIRSIDELLRRSVKNVKANAKGEKVLTVSHVQNVCSDFTRTFPQVSSADTFTAIEEFPVPTIASARPAPAAPAPSRRAKAALSRVAKVVAPTEDDDGDEEDGDDTAEEADE